MPHQTCVISFRHLDRAVSYVSDYWLPASPKTAERINQGLAKGEYQSNIDLLIEHMRGDLSLFSRCVLQLKDLVRGEEQSVDLISQMRTLSYDRLEGLVTKELNRHSFHSFDDSSSLQSNRFREALVSWSGAEALGKAAKVGEGAGYSAALLRQLGYALIAWNYPSVYEQAVLKLHEEPRESLDNIIARRLGFTPTLLAARLCYEWGLPEDLCDAIGEPASPLHEKRDRPTGTTGTLWQICRVGEALARSHQPHIYPSARTDWEGAKTAIAEALGPAGLTEIGQRIAQYASNYPLPEALEPEAPMSSVTFGAGTSNEDEPTYGNPWLEHCDPKLRIRLQSLYQLMEKSKDVPKCLESLVQDVIPTARFTGGIVYTSDPTTTTLLPQTEIGHIELREVAPVTVEDSRMLDDIVNKAHTSSQLCIIETNEDLSLPMAMAAPFGKSNALGILYLELPKLLFIDDPHQRKIEFNAICRALSDCVGKLL